MTQATRAPQVLAATQLRLAADSLVSYRYRVWHYGESVALEGLLRAAALLDEPRYSTWVHGLLRGWAARRHPFVEIDNTLPGKVLCEVANTRGDHYLVDAAVDAADHLIRRTKLHGVAVPFERAPLREPFGGAPLSGRDRALLEDPGRGVFVDCLHFDPPFLVALGRLTGRGDLVDEGADQAAAIVELLQDGMGAFHHFYLERSDRKYGLGWGRGQGWAMLGLVDLLASLPEDHPRRPSLLDALRRLSAVLRETQLADGGWRAVIADPHSGPESSTAAFVAAGLGAGIRHGLLGAENGDVAREAWRATASRVRPDGILEGVSENVWASTGPSHLANVPLGANAPWGQGPLLLAAFEHWKDASAPEKGA